MGFTVATTVLTAAASHDLTDLVTVKDELSIQGNDKSADNWLNRATDQVSRAIERECRRTFVPEVVQDVFDIQRDAYPWQTPGGMGELVLSRDPVLSVLSVALTASPSSTQDLVEGTDYRVDTESGRLLRLDTWSGSVIGWPAIPVTVRYVAGYGSVVAEQAAVPASSPYTVTVGGAATFSCDIAVATAAGAALTRVTGTPAAGQYAVSAAGVYTFAAADAGTAMVITHALRAVPSDVVSCCLQLITDRYYSRGRDPSLVQRDTPGVGTERWWFGNAPGQNGPFPPDIAAALELYRTPVVA